MSRLLASLAAELDRCNKCGFCLAGCPTYQIEPMEWLVTRGRISLMQDLLAGRLEPHDPGYRQAIDSCLMCRACVSHCPPQVQIDRLIRQAKADRREREGLPLAEQLIYRGLLPRPRLLRAAAWAAHVADSLGLRRLALRSGALRRWPVLERAASTGPAVPGITGRTLIANERRAEPPLAAPRDRVVYFLGCSKNLLYPRAALATYRVLRINGVEAEVPLVGCCGLPAFSAGDEEGARALARQNLAILQATGARTIVVDESSCCSHLARVGDLFAGMPEEEAMRQLGARVVDLSVYLDRLGIRTPGPLPGRVAWHDPCHLRHHQGVTEAPRRLLRLVPGSILVEPATDGGCCGGAGAYMLTQPELSDAILRNRIKALREAGVEILVTGSPSCITQYARAADGLPVLYLSEFLEQAYQRATVPHEPAGEDSPKIRPD